MRPYASMRPWRAIRKVSAGNTNVFKSWMSPIFAIFVQADRFSCALLTCGDSLIEGFYVLSGNLFTGLRSAYCDETFGESFAHASAAVGISKNGFCRLSDVCILLPRLL